MPHDPTSVSVNPCQQPAGRVQVQVRVCHVDSLWYWRIAAMAAFRATALA
jgi:hypothetical protein